MTFPFSDFFFIYVDFSFFFFALILLFVDLLNFCPRWRNVCFLLQKRLPVHVFLYLPDSYYLHAFLCLSDFCCFPYPYSTKAANHARTLLQISTNTGTGGGGGRSPRRIARRRQNSTIKSTPRKKTLYHRVTGGGERMPITTRKERANDHRNDPSIIIRASKAAWIEPPNFQPQRMSPAMSNEMSDKTNQVMGLRRNHQVGGLGRGRRPTRGGPTGATRPRVIRTVNAFRA